MSYGQCTFQLDDLSPGATGSSIQAIAMQNGVTWNASDLNQLLSAIDSEESGPK
jgi:hypothetical protein